MTHPVQGRLPTPPGSTSPTLFEWWCGFFYVPQEPEKWKCCETGATAYSPYPGRLESLPISRCHYKGSTFFPVSVGPASVLSQLSQPGAIRNVWSPAHDLVLQTSVLNIPRSISKHVFILSSTCVPKKGRALVTRSLIRSMMCFRFRYLIETKIERLSAKYSCPAFSLVKFRLRSPYGEGNDS